jgi:metal-responsive CopG/Arc/MetJ family transcriptional regulator
MSVKVMLSFPDEFLTQIDTLAEVEQRSRSELVREALRQYMVTHAGALRPGDQPQVRAAVESFAALAQISPGVGEDSAEVIRYWRDERR